MTMTEKIVDGYGPVPMDDPYNMLVVRFSELQAQGYPVGFEPTHPPLPYNSSKGRQHESKLGHYLLLQVDRYNEWATPTVYEPRFAGFLNDIDILPYDENNSSLRLFNTGTDYWAMKQTAENHPVQLVEAVGKCWVDAIVEYNSRLRSGIDTHTIQSMDV